MNGEEGVEEVYDRGLWFASLVVVQEFGGGEDARSPLRISLSSSFNIIHSLCNDVSYSLGRLDKVIVREMSIARRGLVPPMVEQLADQGQVLARHDGMTREIIRSFMGSIKGGLEEIAVWELKVKLREQYPAFPIWSIRFDRPKGAFSCKISVLSSPCHVLSGEPYG